MQESIGNEFFPPTEEELNEIIAELKRRLEDESYEEEWVKSTRNSCFAKNN
ncbi:hypothetical protein [Riemerella anatipestifer]|uniref:hypothetical protein n=1 Tax=Riemerella anatipestifer TaxID=34085 RepID=UPI0021D5D1EA|nr:hypothetical protein [Riemerella anatipestifer]MCU7539562.1 hypothetical protein [Riemerella anatipestifer]